MHYDLTKLVGSCPEVDETSIHDLKRQITRSVGRGLPIERFFSLVFQREHKQAVRRCWVARDKETGEVPEVDYKELYRLATNQLSRWLRSLYQERRPVSMETLERAMLSVGDFTVTADTSDNPVQIMTYTAAEPTSTHVPDPIPGDVSFRLNLSPITPTQDHEHA